MRKFVIAKQLPQRNVKAIKAEFRGDIWSTYKLYKSACLFANNKITIFFRDYLTGRLKLTVELIVFFPFWSNLSVSDGQGLKNTYDSNLSYLIFDVLFTACFKGSRSHLLTEVMF